MKSLVWKECQENLKWVPLPTLLILGPMGLMGVPSLMDPEYLFYVSLVAALFGAVLGFLQVFPESSGDRRSLLLHRPLGRSQIFLGKALAGVGLYLLAVGVPFACAVGLAATPGNVAEPFGRPMPLPWLADSLTGLVYYFAGMLTAQREARWYGSRCLGLATGLGCSILVWTLPDFWQALAAVAALAGVAAVAAWGSFLAGGAYAPQPRLARAALAGTFLAGLLALGFVGKSFLGGWLSPKSVYWYELDRRGRVLLVHHEAGTLRIVTDLRGQPPDELRGKRLDRYGLQEVVVPWARGGAPETRSYRNKNRFLVEYTNPSRPGGEKWWYVPDRGRLLGYDQRSNRFIGSFGPDGFARPDEQPGGRFHGGLAHLSRLYFSRAAPYLAFPGGVYTVDFRALKVRTLFAPADGETVLWASRWEDEARQLSVAFVGTDRSVHVVDESGARLLSAARAYERERYRVTRVGLLEGPRRYWVWYEPAWYLGPETLETMPAHLVVYDDAGRELPSGQEVAPRPGGVRGVTPHVPLVEPSPALALFGPVTSPAEAAILAGAMRHVESEVRRNGGTETPLLLQFLLVTTQFFVPGVRWDPGAHPGLVSGYAALMLLSAGACALACWLLARRHAFSRARRVGWSLCGLLWGPAGLLLLLAVQEWPARVVCPGCRRPRVVTRDACEHCGAAHASPAPDGTEIFEEVAATPHGALARS
jgi:hypothetical protein